MELGELKRFLLLVFGKLQDLEAEMLATGLVLLEGGECLEGGPGWIARVEELRETSDVKDGVAKRYKTFVSQIEAATTDEELVRIVRSWRPFGRIVH